MLWTDMPSAHNTTCLSTGACAVHARSKPVLGFGHAVAVFVGVWIDGRGGRHARRAGRGTRAVRTRRRPGTRAGGACTSQVGVVQLDKLNIAELCVEVLFCPSDMVGSKPQWRRNDVLSPGAVVGDLF